MSQTIIEVIKNNDNNFEVKGKTSQTKDIITAFGVAAYYVSMSYGIQKTEMIELVSNALENLDVVTEVATEA